MSERKKILELKKHVATIHSTNKLSLLQRKIANALLFNAYDELLIKDEHQIHIPSLCNLIGYDSNDHKTIKKALINLLATVIEWNLVDGNLVQEEGVWNASSIIADASIDGAICTYSYSNKMKKLLYHPGLYGRLNMLVQAKFQSSYGLALYENCIRYQNIEHTPWFDLIKFRKLMGVDDSKYKIFRDFKNRVLDKAIEEVNRYSQIFITVQLQKRGRQVVAIQFLIKCLSQNVSTLCEFQEKKSLTLSETLKIKFGLSKTQIDEVLSNFDQEYIYEKMVIVEASPSFNNGKIINLAKYFLCALNDDYQPVKSTKPLSRPKASALSDESISKNRKIEYENYLNAQLLKKFEEQPEAMKKTILEEFSRFLGTGIYFETYKKVGLTDILIQDQLILFFKHKRPEFIVGLITFKEYCSIFGVVT